MHSVHMKGNIGKLWTEMSTEKGDLIDRAKQYAKWTLPYLMPENPENRVNQEQIKSSVPNGGKMVNHLANRIVETLFPLSRSFFTLGLSPLARMELEQQSAEDLQQQLDEIRQATTNAENIARDHLNLVAYRPVAIEGIKYTLVTGNSLIRRMPSGNRVVYGIDRYCLRRDEEGNPIEAILYAKKKLANFDEGLRDLIKAQHPGMKDHTEAVLLTHYKKMPDGRWQVMQEAEGVAIGKAVKYAEKDLDILPLAWNLPSGEHYATGLVEDNAVLFHNIDVVNMAMIDLIGIVSDVKFYIRPGSPLSTLIHELNNSPRGAYLPGVEGDIHIPEAKISGNLQHIAGIVERWEKELSEAFLLTQVRDAERVTAEEIRQVARQLESAFGGIYSRLALNWQQKEAEYLVNKINKDGMIPLDKFRITVTTGIESLSREGQLENYRLAVADLSLLDQVPESVQDAFNPLRTAHWIFAQRGLHLVDFLNSQEEIRAIQEQRLAQAGREMQEQAKANIAEEAGKQMVNKAAQN